MPNLAATLKEEIRRLARKEIREQMGATRRAAVQHRREIAKLKKQLAVQQRMIAGLKAKRREPDEEVSDDTGIPEGSRFSARSVRAQRRRLKLTAAEYGKLIGVSAQTVYLWERGKVRPGKAQFAALIQARDLTRRDALQCLQQKTSKK
jgi:DNA-binding transcriptional regulator YiaG